MNEQLGWLVRLQEFYTRLDQILAKREQIPLDIEATKQSVLRSTAEYEKIKARYESVNRDRKDKEIDLGVEEQRLEKLKGRTAEIKTNKEYHALLVEIETGKQVKDKLEEVLLLLMEEVDQVKQQAEEKKKAVEEEGKQADLRRQSLEAELEETEKMLKQVAGKAKEVESKLPERLLKEYHNLRPFRNGLAVAPVQDGTCQGCRLSVPPQLYADVRKNEQILACSYCHRFLYWPTTTLQAQSTS